MKIKDKDARYAIAHLLNEINNVEGDGLTFMAIHLKDDDMTILLKTFDFKSGKDELFADIKRNMKYIELKILSMVDEIENGTGK